MQDDHGVQSSSTVTITVQARPTARSTAPIRRRNLTGTPADDRAFSRARRRRYCECQGGNDVVYGGDGADTLNGEAGNDVVEAAADDDIVSAETASTRCARDDGRRAFGRQ
jgi:Ca2+-binding RTX toxin-like protein